MNPKDHILYKEAIAMGYVKDNSLANQIYYALAYIAVSGMIALVVLMWIDAL